MPSSSPNTASLLGSELPRGRGFNLLEMFSSRSECAWQEHDFQWIAEWGFDFVRLPLSYPNWLHWWEANPSPYEVHEAGLERVDHAVELCMKYGLHVCLNFHRGPGYSVNRDRVEPFDLWKSRDALDAFCFHWRLFAERYRGIDSRQLSFNLINEPPEPGDVTWDMSLDDYHRVIRAAVDEIRSVDPGRLIIADGLKWGNAPCPDLVDMGLGQGCRAYLPFELSHYKAYWFEGSDGWPVPVWPDLAAAGVTWNRAALEEHYRPWADLKKRGVWVHCGEGGAYRSTPHAVVLAWLRDVLEVLASHGISLALWNFRGEFGILDSGREDVDYEDFHGHMLDRKLLSLLQEFA